MSAFSLFASRALSTTGLLVLFFYTLSFADSSTLSSFIPTASVLPLSSPFLHAAFVNDTDSGRLMSNPSVDAASSPQPSSFCSSFLSSLVLIFVAEFGDKTFLATLFLSSTLRNASSLFSASSVTLIAATNAAAATLAILSALLSVFSLSLSSSVAPLLLRTVASLVCLYFALSTIHDAYHDTAASDAPIADADGSASSSSSSLLSLFASTYAVSIATELFDQSQFSFLLLTSDPTASVVGVVMGGVLGHVLCTTLAMVGGGWLHKLGWKERTVRLCGGGLFLAITATSMLR